MTPLSTAQKRSAAHAPEARACSPAEADASLEGYRQSMRRFLAASGRLPYATQATCPQCRQVVPAAFELAGSQLVLRFDCPTCPPVRQVHQDVIWTQGRSDFPGSPTHTLGGQPIQPVTRRLPRTVSTLCPECGAIVVGREFVAGGRVLIEKTCPEHGYFSDCVNSDVLLYSKAAWWTFEEAPGQQFPQTQASDPAGCPSDCGLCTRHLSSPCLAQIDLTNRCNMRCPICFANAGVTGRVYEPDFEEIRRQLQVLRDLRPTPCTAIQFTGGEPTIHPDFLRIGSTAGEMGFSHIQIATNGLRMAEGDFAQRCAQAGLHTLYLQFDGVGDEAHRYTRNYPGLWAKRLAAIDAVRAAGMKICLVPTLVKGVNDDQVGEIFRFAVEHIDVVSGISFQPVSFTGRIPPEQRHSQRYTLGDLGHDLAAASGASALRDMYPLSIVSPLSQLLEALTGHPKIRPSCHPDCAFGTYFLVAPDGRAVPFPQVIDVEGMFTDMNRTAARIRARGRVTWLDRIRVARMFKRHFRPESAPAGLTVKKFIRSLMGMVDKHVGRGPAADTYKTLLCAGMHFQDRYNYDAQRAQRCVILYSTPAGVFPFCTYNCGPEYRPAVERDYVRESGYTRL
ncbi:MAG: radical SAM protein [Planctomycetota bacterium]|nr:radical SAM protein [Planctomycetota bacterium]